VKRYIAALLVVGAITRLVNVTEANVVYLDYDFWGPDKTYEWNFDDDLQQLTVTESIFEFGPDYLWSIKIGGKVDSDTAFSVVLLPTIPALPGLSWRCFLAPLP